MDSMHCLCTVSLGAAKESFLVQAATQSLQSVIVFKSLS